MVAEQLQIRRVEYLRDTANPVDLQIMGIEGRAAIHRETIKTLKMPTEDIIPTKEEMQARTTQQQQLLLEQGPPPQEGEAEVLPGGQRAGKVE